MSDDDSESLLAYTGLGGAAVCCLGIELLGGAAILGGLAATIGLSTGLTYLVIVGGGALVGGSAARVRAVSGVAGSLGGILVSGLTATSPLFAIGLVLR